MWCEARMMWLNEYYVVIYPNSRYCSRPGTNRWRCNMTPYISTTHCHLTICTHNWEHKVFVNNTQLSTVLPLHTHTQDTSVDCPTPPTCGPGTDVESVNVPGQCCQMHSCTGCELEPSQTNTCRTPLSHRPICALFLSLYTQWSMPEWRSMQWGWRHLHVSYWLLRTAVWWVWVVGMFECCCYL